MLLKMVKKAILKRLIREAIEEMPEIKKQALNLYEAHKDEVIQQVKNHVKIAIQNFVVKKIDSAKVKIVKITGHNN